MFITVFDLITILTILNLRALEGSGDVVFRKLNLLSFFNHQVKLFHSPLV